MTLDPTVAADLARIWRSALARRAAAQADTVEDGTETPAERAS